MKTIAACTVMAFALSGCCNTPVKPVAPMELGEAIKQVRLAIGSAQKYCRENKDKCQSGLLLSGGEISLELSRTESGTLGASIPIGTSTLTAESKRTDSGTNTITLKFTSALFADKDTAAAHCAVDAEGKFLDDVPTQCRPVMFQAATSPAAPSVAPKKKK